MKLNVGCGQRILSGFVNIDKYPQHPEVQVINIDDNGLRMFEDNSFDEIVCHGCLNEFKSDVITVMNEFWRVLESSGKLDIIVAVVDNSKAAHRDPLAHRYLHSDWVQYFVEGGSWETSGKGIGFKGKFRLFENTVNGEVHHVLLGAIK